MESRIKELSNFDTIVWTERKREGDRGRLRGRREGEEREKRGRREGEEREKRGRREGEEREKSQGEEM